MGTKEAARTVGVPFRIAPDAEALHNPAMIPRWTVLLALLLAASLFPKAIAEEDDGGLSKVKEAIQKAEKELAEGKKKGGYTEEQMKSILTAVEGYFAVPARKVLAAKLEFEAHEGERVAYVRRSTKKTPRYTPIGKDTEVVEVKKKTGKTQRYSIKDGDVESLQQIEAVAFGLQQAFKDTPLENSGTRRQWPVLKNIHTLMVQLPRFAQKYLNLDGMGAANHDDRLAEVEAMRKQLIEIYDELAKQMGELKKGAAKEG